MKLRPKLPSAEQPRPGQIGKFWLSKKPGRADKRHPWCRTWYADGRVHHKSLRTADLDEASRLLRDYVAKTERTEHAPQDQVTIDQALLAYWEDHGQHTPSARTTKQNLAKWHEFWAGEFVSALTPNRQLEFHQWLGKGTLAPSTIDKILSSGRAALLRAVKWQQLAAAPHIFSVETQDQKRSRHPLGRPITPIEIAAFIDAINQRNLLVLTLLCANTLARPTSLFDLRRVQYDAEHQLLHLNPEGRIQTRKHRPTLPVTPTLRPWLEAETDPGMHLITFRGEPVKALGPSWNKTLKRAGLPAGLTPYSFRHGMAREMRKRHVPTEQISLFLGHIVTGGTATTSIYAPFEPDYCEKAVEAIEDVMAEVRKLLKVGTIDDPQVTFTPKTRRGTNIKRLTDLQKAELHRRILIGGTNDTHLARELGISSNAVRKHRIKLGMPSQSACRARAADKKD